MPDIPFVDVATNVGTPAPAQIVEPVPKEKVGVTFELMVTFSDVVVAHWLASGVNV